MKAIKKYFQFSGTIDGTHFFLRNLIILVATLVIFGIVGLGAGLVSPLLMCIGLLLLVATLWLSITTLYKRINALFPKKVAIYTIGLVSLYLVDNAMEPTFVRLGLSIILLIIGMVLILKESNIKTHNG